MPIEYSNLLVQNEIIPIGNPTTTMTMQQIAVRDKVVHLFRGNACNPLIRYFMGPDAKSIVMQQHFQNSETVCAFVMPNGTAIHLDEHGYYNDGNFNHLDDPIREKWSEIQTTQQEYKTGLILSTNAFEEYMNNFHANVPDRRFSSAFRNFLAAL